VSTNDPEPDGEQRETRTERGQDLSIDRREEAGRSIVTVLGELDLYTAPNLRESVLEVADDGQRQLIIDLSGVPFMDSSGLGVIVACLKRLREAGGDLALVTRPDSPPTKLLSLTGLDRAIPTFTSLDEALADPR